jgi:TPR repeat protein
LPVTIAIANTDFQLVQMQKDYYQILAIIDSAEDVVIKAAYKALIHIYHPDRYEGDKHEATQKTKDILEAYRVLSNPESRAEYDQSRGVTPKQAKPQTPVKPHTMSESQLRGLVKQGDIDAQMELGKRYFNGNGLPQSFTEAFSYFRKAADYGNPNAQTVLGFMYANGIGVEDNEIKAFIWFRKAAEQANHDAQFRLGLCFYAGFGVEQNYQDALIWLQQSAEQGNSNAQYLIGFIYANGDGVVEDQQQAVVWYRKAALQGNQSAQDELKQLGVVW